MSVMDKSLKVVVVALESLKGRSVTEEDLNEVTEALRRTLQIVDKSAYDRGHAEGYDEGFMDGDEGGPTQ